MRLNKNKYRDRRVSQAVASGFKRTGVVPTKKQVDALKVKLTALWELKQGTECPMLCGVRIQPRNCAFCHNKALANSGKHTALNIYLSCSRCNRAQHTLSKKEYLTLRKAVIDCLGEDRWKKIRAWLAGSRY